MLNVQDTLYRYLIIITALALSLPALASDHTVSITGIEVVNDGTNDRVAVIGAFTPSLGCTKQGFWLYSSEPYFKEIYSMLLTAKATAFTVKYTYVYCHANGYSRGNYFMLQ